MTTTATTDLRTLADVKRALQPGARVHCDNQLHPAVSGWRTIIAAGSWIKYDRDGHDEPGWLRWPKRADVRIEGRDVAWIDHDGTVAFTWTIPEPQEA